MNENYGDQHGNGSINVGVGDFRGATLTVTNERHTFTAKQMHIRRHFAMGGRGMHASTLSTFGIVTGLAGLAQLYFTIFPPFGGGARIFSSWENLAWFSFLAGFVCFIVAYVLRHQRFQSFLFDYYLEADSAGKIYITSLTAVCPWCGSKMNLRHIGPKDGPKADTFICKRNPRQHRIELDPTCLEPIEG